jgi:hypothetical protein
VVSAKPQIQIADNEQESIEVSVKPQLPEIPDWLRKK